MQITERVAGCYEVQEVEFGRVYSWRPESVVVECDCGKKSTFERSALVGSTITCECGEDRTADVQEEVVARAMPEYDEALHPRRYWHSSGDARIPF